MKRRWRTILIWLENGEGRGNGRVDKKLVEGQKKVDWVEHIKVLMKL